MTGPIKPPGSTPHVPLPPTKGESTSSVGERFRDARLRVATEAQAPERAGASSDPILEALRAGTLDRAGALDALVARTLASSAAEGLTPAGRAALEQHLRRTLAEDPAFVRLVDELR